MNCKNCGYPLFSNDKFCKNCGQEVVRESDINPVVVENKIDNGPIVDPTKPTIDNVQMVNNEIPPVNNNQVDVPKPAINDGPIAPVVFEGNGMKLPDIAAKKVDIPAANYDKIDGTKSVSTAMSMMGTMPPKSEEAIPNFDAEKEEVKVEEPSIANVNQVLPTLPNEKKETTSSVIIPTKPKPINNVENNEPMMNQPVNNNYNNNNNSNNYNNNNNNYNNSPYGNTQFNNQYNNNQPMNNNEPQEVEQKKKSNPILILLVLIILGVGGYFGYKYLIKNGGSEPTKNVSYSGYEFKVFEKYKTQVNSNSLVAYNDDVILSFAFINGSYSDFSSALTLENFNSLGNTASYMGEKERNGNKYHYYKVTVSGKETYIGYVASGVTKIICFGVEAKTGTALPSEEYLNNAIDIAMSATYNGSSNMESNVVDEDSSVVTASQALIGEEENTGDINEDVYEDIYVNITLEEINE